MNIKKRPTHAKILRITEKYNTSERGYNGIIINTDKGNIKLLISGGQECCETTGTKFLETPDKIQKYIGSKIIDIKIIHLEEYDVGDNTHRETQLKIITTKGVLQYAVYNEHNGYYGHAVISELFNEKTKECL